LTASAGRKGRNPAVAAVASAVPVIAASQIVPTARTRREAPAIARARVLPDRAAAAPTIAAAGIQARR
jgi:hypothetical protein